MPKPRPPLTAGKTDNQQWRQLLGQAVLERDPVKLRPLVDAAQFAIVERLRALKPLAVETVEHMDLIQGMRILRRLQVERLHYPSYPSL